MALLSIAPCVRSQANAPTITGTDLLDRLVGNWIMQGNVRGKPVEYTLTVRRILQDKYVELHMTDAASPSTYEARVIIGTAAKRDEVIAHWIDNTGAQYSVPPATGAIRGDTLVLDFPYSARPFHDELVFDRAMGRWRFVLDAADGHGGWTRFATYDVLRRPRATR